MKHAGTAFPRADKARAAAAYELNKRPLIVAVDLGTTTCGIAALYRRYEYDAYDVRYGYHTVTATSVPLDGLRATLKRLRPRVVIAEESAGGYSASATYRAKTGLRDACKELSATLYLTNVSTWKKQAFGSHRVTPETMRSVALQRLRDLRVEHVDALYAEASLDRDAVAALRLLACWRPSGISLSRGRSSTVISVSEYIPRGFAPRGISKSARRLYAALYAAGSAHSRPGIIKQCRAAHIAYGNYRRFLGELAGTGAITVRGEHPIEEIHLNGLKGAKAR